MRNTKKPKIRKGAWFYRLRGSYFPCSWQGWLIEVAIVVMFFLGLFAFNDQNLSLGLVAVIMLPYTVALGLIASWIAQVKS